MKPIDNILRRALTELIEMKSDEGQKIWPMTSNVTSVSNTSQNFG